MQAQVRAVGGQVDAREHHLFVPGGSQLGHLPPQVLQGLGAHPPPGVGDDAVRAEPVAAVLDFEKGPGAAGKGRDGEGLEGLARGVGGHVHQALLCGEELPQAGDQVGPAGVAQDDIRLQEGGGGIGESLGHAAGEHGHAAGVVPFGAAQGLADLVVALGGDGAGVDHHHPGGLCGGSLGITGLEESLQHGLGLVLIDLAAQGDEFNFHGNTSKIE